MIKLFDENKVKIKDTETDFQLPLDAFNTGETNYKSKN